MYGCFLTRIAVIIISASHIISVRQKKVRGAREKEALSYIQAKI